MQKGDTVADQKGKLSKAVYDLGPEVQAQIDALISGESATPVVEGTAPAEAPTPTVVAAPSATGAVAEVEPVSTEAVVETPSAQAVEGTPAITDYYGYDLSDIPEEARQGFVDELKERDTLINKLLRERAEAEANPPAPAAPVAPVAETPLTDEDILIALGQDPEMLDESAARALVLLGRQLVETKAQVEQMAEQSAVQQTQFFWESSLDKLEAQYGKLPIAREGVGGLFEYAIKNVINDPSLAYWAVVGPTRAEVHTEVQKLKGATAEAKRAAATLRPSAATDLSAVALESKDTKSATKEALDSILKAAGIG